MGWGFPIRVYHTRYAFRILQPTFCEDLYSKKSIHIIVGEKPTGCDKRIGVMKYGKNKREPEFECFRIGGIP